MPALADPIAKRLERAFRTPRFDGIRAKCRRDGIPELLQGAAEDLAARFELGTQAKETEPVVPRWVEA